MDDLRIKARALPVACWRSLEQAFYTLYVEEQMDARLNPLASAADLESSPVVSLFVQCIQAVLRSAHGTHSCLNHRALVDRLHKTDAVLSFNYDLVIERAIRDLASDMGQIESFGAWVYGHGARPEDVDIPCIFKLHGSSNWEIDADRKIVVKTQNWEHAFEQPGYRSTSSIPSSASYPILLPYWEKPIEQEPWITIWQRAYGHLKKTKDILVWGYSLPPTDIKARHLFRLAQPDPVVEHLCVIDPSEQSRHRWRELFPDAQYWQYPSFADFRKDAPEWWLAREGNVSNWPSRIT